MREIRGRRRTLRVLEFPLKKLDYRRSPSLPQLLSVSRRVVLFLKDDDRKVSVVDRLSQFG